MAYRSLWAETNPYALQLERENNEPTRGWGGFGKLLGRGLSSLVPERTNETFDPAARVSDTNVPFQKAGFFRALAGDRSNMLNSAAKMRGVDIDQSSVAAEQEQKRKDAFMREQQGFMDNRLREKLGADARLAEIKHHDDNLMRLDKDASYNERLRNKFNLDSELLDRRLGNQRTLRGVPQALDPSTVRVNEGRANKMAADAAQAKSISDLLAEPDAPKGRGLWGTVSNMLGWGAQDQTPARQTVPSDDDEEILIDPADLQELGIDPDEDEDLQ